MAGQGKLEAATGPGLRLHPDPAAIAFNDLFADGQANAVSRVFRAGVQALEDNEDVFRELWRNSNSVIAHGELPSLSGSFSLHGNHWRLLPAELDGIPDQILEDLRQLRAVGPHHGKRIMGDHSATLLDGGRQNLQYIGHDSIAVDRPGGGVVPADARKRQQILD